MIGPGLDIMDGFSASRVLLEPVLEDSILVCGVPRQVPAHESSLLTRPIGISVESSGTGVRLPSFCRELKIYL